MVTREMIEKARALDKQGWATLMREFKLSQNEAKQLAGFLKLEKIAGEKLVQPKEMIMSAWNESGKVMDIDQYCEYYNLPRKDIRDYKLVTHTGTPYYNTKFIEHNEATEFITEEFVQDIVSKYSKANKSFTKPEKTKAPTYTRTIFSDAHIGMDPNSEGIAMYPGIWDLKAQQEAFDYLADRTVMKAGNLLIIDNLGDYLDGQDKQTVRRGHELPQNMSNEEMFDNGVNYLVTMADKFVSAGIYESILFNNICNSNHPGSFDYYVASAVKGVLQNKYPGLVSVVNHKSFMNHYTVGSHTFVISHGKDKKNLKFGFKVKIDDTGEKKISNYIRENRIASPYIEFSKGDSHQCLFDYCSSDVFDYMNYLSLAPSSEWVQTNFQKGRRGFVIQQFNEHCRDKDVLPVFMG